MGGSFSSNVNLEDLKKHYDQCKDQMVTLKDGETEKQLLPKLAAGDKYLELGRILDGEVRKCESKDILDGAEDGGTDGGGKTDDDKDSTAGITEGEWDHEKDRKDEGTKPLGEELKG